MSGVDGATSLLTQSWHRPCNERGSKLVRATMVAPAQLDAFTRARLLDSGHAAT